MKKLRSYMLFVFLAGTTLVAACLTLRRSPLASQRKISNAPIPWLASRVTDNEVTPLPEVVVTGDCIGILRGTVIAGTGVDEVLARPWDERDPRLSSWKSAMEAVGGRQRIEGVVSNLPGRVAGLCSLGQNQFVVVYLVGEQEYVALKIGERLTVIPGARAFNATATGDDVFPCAIATVAGRQVWRCFAGLSADEGSSAPLYQELPIAP